MPQEKHRSDGEAEHASLAASSGDLPDGRQGRLKGGGWDPAHEVLKIALLAALAVVIVGVAAVMLTGCAAGPDGARSKPAPSKPAPSAPTALPGPKAQAAEKALAAYTGYYRAYNAAMADPSKSAEVAKYAGYPLRTEAGLWLKQMIDKGMVARGEPKVEPTSTEVSDDVKKVTITGCYDNKGTTIVIKATGKNVTAPGQAQRYVTVAVVEPYADGTWLVSKITPQRSTPC